MTRRIDCTDTKYLAIFDGGQFITLMPNDRLEINEGDVLEVHGIFGHVVSVWETECHEQIIHLCETSVSSSH